MKEFFIFRESDNFDDILKDPNLKRKVHMILRFGNSLMLQLDDDDTTISYLMLKYGDDIVETKTIIADRTPIPDKDYTPPRPKNILH